MPGHRDGSRDCRDYGKVTLPSIRDLFRGELASPLNGAPHHSAYSLPRLRSPSEPQATSYPASSSNHRHQANVRTVSTTHDNSYQCLREAQPSPEFPSDHEGSGRSAAPVASYDGTWQTCKATYATDNVGWAHDNQDASSTGVQQGHYGFADRSPSGELRARTTLPPQTFNSENSKKNALQFQQLPHPRSHSKSRPQSAPGSSSGGGASNEYTSPYGVLIAELDPNTVSYSDPQRLAILRTLRAVGGSPGALALNADDALLSARYECPYCTKRFNRPSSLKIHINSHTGERPYECPEPGCGRRFSVQSNMRRHTKVHQGGGSKGGESSGEDDQCDDGSLSQQSV